MSNNFNQEEWIHYSHGMALNKGNTTGERDNENGILFLVELFFVKHLRGELTQQDIDIFKQITIDLRSYKNETDQVDGLYDRGAGESLFAFLTNTQDKVRTISHDNLTAIAAFSNKFNLPFAKHIVKYGLKHWMIFNNRYPDTNKLINQQWHPRDWFFWLWCAGGLYRLLSLIFLPVFLGASLVTCMSPKNIVSGKMLLFTRLQSDDGLLFKIMRLCFFSILRKRYGDRWFHAISKIYFYQKDHPTPILSENLRL